ncbi:hypothetical protein RRG08_016579 [Elysia crispata]|uniref:Uncharacterized protein n=1 Tax=Elysia crispata TaxID=231223 RepID=A0AAE1ATK3_9GAST|nr:hypothetical protein RRG08_016579 [Elysia crispata]
MLGSSAEAGKEMCAQRVRIRAQEVLIREAKWIPIRPRRHSGFCIAKNTGRLTVLIPQLGLCPVLEIICAIRQQHHQFSRHT